MQSYQKDGVTGSLCQSFPVADWSHILQSVPPALARSCEHHRNALSLRLLFDFANYLYSISVKFNSSTILILP